MGRKFLQKGFTLIELLIVMAVLGVLISVVLIAIDPAEQLARGRDAGKKSSVSQLGHAMTVYMTGQTAGATPPALGAIAGATTLDATNWQTFLVSAGEVKITSTNGASSTCAVAQATSKQGGYCYLISGTDFLVWAFAESKSEKSKAPSCTVSTQVAAEVYDSSQGKTGVACLTNSGTAPTTGQGLN